MAAEVSLKFLLSEKSLVVANKGQFFTKSGLRSICQAHLSSKVDKKKEAHFSDKADAEKTLKVIRSQRLSAYNSCQDDIREHANLEHSLRSEYSGRVLIELIQNAHDALAKTPIGYKGIGFKGVLNISDHPRIYSGELTCQFNRKKSKIELLEAGLGVFTPQQIPLLRLPFTSNIRHESSEIQKLRQEFDTVIVLPFRNKKVFTRFLTEWGQYSNDPSVLLFLPFMNVIFWEECINGNSKSKSFQKLENKKIVEIVDNLSGLTLKRFKVFRTGNASIALELTEQDMVVSMSPYPKIRVFFQTEDNSPLPILIHADLPLKEGRSDVLVADLEIEDKLKNSIDGITDLIIRALESIKDPGLILDLIKPRIEPDQMDRIEDLIWKSQKTKLHKLKLPNTNGTKLGEVRLRPDDSYWLNCELWSQFKKLISDHRRNSLKGLKVLPPEVDTIDRENTILHLNPEARLDKELMRKIPFIPVGKRGTPYESLKASIYFQPDINIPDPPNFLDIRFLNPFLVQALRSSENKDGLERIFLFYLDVKPFNISDLISRSVLPILKKEGSNAKLVDFLFHTVTPVLSEKQTLFDWRDQTRCELSELLHVRCRSNVWRPVKEVYAGKEWTGETILEYLYSNRDDRGFLHKPHRNKDVRKKQEHFYKWLGVGWYPKVLPLILHCDEKETFIGALLNRGEFEIHGKPPRWKEYCGSISGWDERKRTARLRQNWTLDGGAEVFSVDNSFETFSKNWKYYSQYKDCVYYWSSNMREDRDNVRQVKSSYFLWLMKNCEWLTVRKSKEKHRPDNVFIGTKVPNKLKGWAFELSEEGDEQFLQDLGIRRGWRDLEDKDWNRWLEISTTFLEDKVNRTQNFKTKIFRLYDAALRHWYKRYSRSAESPGYTGSHWYRDIWALERLPDNKESYHFVNRTWNSLGEVYYLDKIYLENLKLPGLRIFPVRLNQLESKAKDKFRLERLSEHLEANVEDGILCKNLMDVIQNTLELRKPAVIAYIKAISEDDEHEGYFIQPKINVYENMNINFILNGESLGITKNIDAYYNESENNPELWLDSSLFHEDGSPSIHLWDEVAAGLVCASKLRFDAQGNIKDLLSYPLDEINKKLLHLGITQDVVENILESLMVEEVVDDSTEQVVLERGTEIEEPFLSDEEQLQPSNIEGEIITSKSPHPLSSPVLELSPLNKRNASTTGGGRSTSQRSTAAGLEAQEWMRSELMRRLGTNEWKISETPKRDVEGRESDIELRHQNEGVFHIEVKHMERNVIYWSEKEVAKANANKSRYFMAILMKGKEVKFEEYWLNDPLSSLSTYIRDGVWTWSGEEKIALADYNWVVPDQRPEKRARFSFRIGLNNENLLNITCEFDKIRSLLNTE